MIKGFSKNRGLSRGVSKEVGCVLARTVWAVKEWCVRARNLRSLVRHLELLQGNRNQAIVENLQLAQASFLTSGPVLEP